MESDEPKFNLSWITINPLWGMILKAPFLSKRRMVGCRRKPSWFPSYVDGFFAYNIHAGDCSQL
jgi:hypothetical protein